MSAHGEPDALLAVADSLIRQPAFPVALKMYCVEVAKLRESPRLLNAIIATETRWSIIGYLLYLSGDTERFGPQGGATYGRLLELCTRRESVGPRVLKTLLGLLQLSSLVQLVPDEKDRRVRYYQPAPQLLHFVQSWMSYAVAALDLLEPDIDRSRFLDNPGFMMRFNISGGRAHLADVIPLVKRMPEPLAALSPMLGSFPVVAGLMEADLLDRGLPSVGRLAWRFGLSRGQVRNIVAAGHDAGLLVAEHGKVMTVTRELRCSFARWVSIELAFYALHMRAPDEPLTPIMDDFF